MKMLLTNWFVSFFGNLAGSIFCVYLVKTSGLFSALASPATVAATKTSLTFTQVCICLDVFVQWLRAGHRCSG